jgi:hypothetical protein
MAVTKVPADLFPARGRKKLHGIFLYPESLSVSALMQTPRETLTAGDDFWG